METSRTERVRQVLRYYGLTITRFAEMMGVSQGALANQFSRDSITLDTIDYISNNFKDVNMRWLLSGDGDMLTEVVSEDLANVLIRQAVRPDDKHTAQEWATINDAIGKVTEEHKYADHQQKMIDQLIQLGMDSQARMIRVNEIVDKLAGVCESFAKQMTNKECECRELKKEVANVHMLLSEIVRNMCHSEGKHINFHDTSINTQNF